MKRIILLIFLKFILLIPVFSETKVKTIKYTNIYDLNLNIVSSIEDNKQLFIEDNSFCYLINNNYYILLSGEYTDCLISTDSIIPYETINKFSDELITKNSDYYLLNDYFDALYSKDINLIYILYNRIIEKNLNNYDFSDWKQGLSFYHDSTAISNTKISFENYYSTYHWNIQKIEKNGEVYKLKINPIKTSDYNQKVNSVLKQINQSSIEILLKVDGDYLSFYLSDKKTLIQTFIRTNEETKNEFESFLRTGKCDLSKVTWPRHADGTCDYDGSKSSTTSSKNTTLDTNVAVNKTMAAYENLKLRSGEATSSSVITVMSSGTKVKILQLGKAEKIDGINSNWVKVEVQKGAKDRDGKEIKAGTVGWCYGGYLKDTADTDSVKKKKK